MLSPRKFHDIDFPEKRLDEKVLLVIRKHWVVYCRLCFWFTVVFIFPALLALWMVYSFFPPSDSQVMLTFYVFSCMYVLYGLLFLCIAWMNEAFDLFILTNERLIDVTQVSFFNRTVASTPFDQIQDTTSKVVGFFPTILNYGNIEVQTAAGDASTFIMDHVPDPTYVTDFILDHVHVDRKHLKKPH